jgi:hypothetical protein
MIEQHSIIKFKDNVVIKTVRNIETQPISDQWLLHYKQLSKTNPALVKVFELIDHETYTMERLDIIDTIENVLKLEQYYYLINKTVICDIITTVNDAWSQSIQASKNLKDNIFFVNCDLSLSIMVLTTDSKVKIIDPESYVFVNNLEYTEKYYMAQINLMSNLQRYYSRTSNV